MRPDYAVVVELPRGLLLTPVWASQTAWRVFSWILLSAARDGAQESVYGHALRFSASHREIGRAIGLSRKSVQTALRLLEAEKVIVRERAHTGRAVVYAVAAYPHEQGAGDGAVSGATARAGLEQRSGQVLDTDNSRCGSRMDLEKCCSRNNSGAMNGATNGAGAGARIGASITNRGNKEVGIGDGAVSGAAARAGLEQRIEQVLDTDNSQSSSRMDIEKCRSGSNPGAVNGATDGAGTGASILDGMPTRPEPHQPNAPSGKPVRWRWTCGACGAESVGMVPAGVVPPPVPCLKSKWGRCDGMAHPERES